MSRQQQDRSGRHRRRARPGPGGSTLTRVGSAFPALLGPGRRAAWRRFVIRRALAVALILGGYGLALAAGAVAATGR